MRNSPRDPLDTASEPSYSGSARVPARPTVAVTVPATPLVSCSSRAYTPASGNPSIWRCASARPRVGRSPFRTRRPESRTLCSAAPATRITESFTVTWVGASRNHTPPGSSTASESTATVTVEGSPGPAARRAKRPPARNAPRSPTRERANHVSESRVPRSAPDAAPKPYVPNRSESSVASSRNAGTGPGWYAPCRRPEGISQSRQRTRSALARASTPTESSAPSRVSRTRAEPLSERPRATVPVSRPTTQATSESSELRLSASKSSESTPPAGRRPCSGRELGVGLESGGRTGEPHWALDGAAQREAGEAAAQPVEGERIGVHVGEEPDRVGARVEPDRAANHARRARAVALRERAREPGVVQRARERTGPVELPAERDGGRQPADRAEIHGRRLHGERLEV